MNIRVADTFLCDSGEAKKVELAAVSTDRHGLDRVDALYVTGRLNCST